MDDHSAGTVAVLGTVGAATGAISAMLVYAMCVRRRRFTMFNTGGGPLNWFERDLLDRANEADKSSKEEFIELGNVAGPGIGFEDKSNPIENTDSVVEEVEWQRRDPPYDTSILDSRKVIQRLSEGGEDDPPRTPSTPIAPPLPDGAVVASDDRMVIVRPQPRTSTGSRLSSVESEVAAFQKQSSWSSSSSLDEVGGELQLSLAYDSSAGILTVRLLEAHDLRARELSGTADPYAKIRLLPDRSNTWQTRVHKRTLNPVFDEDFVFETNSLAGMTLEILLYDFDPISRHRGIGYVRVRLPVGPELIDSKPVAITKPILRYGAEGSVYRSDPLGELMISLFYDPSAAQLRVIVVRAIHLAISTDDGASADTYVKVTIHKDGKGLNRKRTGICRDGNSPVWNEVLTFDLGTVTFSACSLDFTVVRTSGDPIARCEVSPNSQKEFFQRVIAGKGGAVQWVPLVGFERRAG